MARTSARASSTSPPRRSASRARRSSQSCSPRHCGRASHRSTTFESKPVEIDAGDRIWRVTNYEDEYLGRVDLARAMVSSDNSVYAQLTKLVGPKAIVKTAHDLGIRSELDPYFSIGLGAVAVNPLDMTRAYATFANRGRPGRRGAHKGPAAGDRARGVRAHRARLRESPGRQGDDDDGAGRSSHVDPRSRRHVRVRASARHSSAGRPPARRARPTTTVTPGSSATRPSSPSPSGSAIPTS